MSLYRNDAPPPLGAILLVALAARLLMLPLPPSDDVYRYAWEGLVRVEGFNPYVLAPNDPALEHLRPAWWGQINHPNHAAIYPPLVQSLFAAVAWIVPEPFAFKALMLLAECGAIAILSLWLRRAQVPLSRIAVYALCPLSLTAVGREGHLDALVVLGLALMLAFTAGTKRLTPRDAILAGAGLGLAIGAKWVAILLAPWCLARALREWGARQIAPLVLGCGVAVLLVAAPAAFYLDHGWRAIFDPLRNFSTEFHNLDYARQWLLRVASEDAASLITVAIVGVVSVTVACARVHGASAIVWTLGAVVVLAPTIHPWYLIWIIPALCVRLSIPWIVLSLTIVLAYEGDHQLSQSGTWSQPSWVAPAVWGPFLVAILLVGLRRGATLVERRSQAQD